MHTNVISVAFTVFFILAVIGSGIISSAFYVIDKETQREKEGKPISVLHPVIVGISGLVITNE